MAEAPHRVEIKPLPSLEEWVKDWQESAVAKAEKWKRRALTPSRDPIKASIAAEGKWKDRILKAIEEGRRKKALEKVSLEDWGAAVAATPPEDFARGIRRKSAKYKKRIQAMYDLWVYAKQKLDAMPVDTAEQRERKLVAAKRVMEVLGLYRKGVITLEEAKRRIDEITSGV